MNNNNLKMYKVGKWEWTDGKHKHRALYSSSPMSKTFKLTQMFCQNERNCWKDNKPSACWSWRILIPTQFRWESKLLNIFRGSFASIKYGFFKDRGLYFMTKQRMLSQGDNQRQEKILYTRIRDTKLFKYTEYFLRFSLGRE